LMDLKTKTNNMKTMNRSKVDNNIIAAFHGIFNEDQDQYFVMDDWYYADSLKYDESWNWLMSVVEKIESLRGVVKMARHWGTMVDDPLEEMYFCTIKIHKGAEIDVAWEDSKREATYQAVVEFAKWYNENKEDE